MPNYVTAVQALLPTSDIGSLISAMWWPFALYTVQTAGDTAS